MADKLSSYPSAPSPSFMDANVEAALIKMQYLSLDLEENLCRDSPEFSPRRLSNTPGVSVGGRKSDPRRNSRGPIESNAEVLFYLHHLQAKTQRSGNGYAPGNGYNNPWEELDYIENGGGRVSPQQQQQPGLLSRVGFQPQKTIMRLPTGSGMRWKMFFLCRYGCILPRLFFLNRRTEFEC